MSTARGFKDHRISTILMFWMWGYLPARIHTNHAVCFLLARNMQLLFFKFPFWFRMFRPGQASRRQTPFTFFPQTYCGVDPWVEASITPLAKPPSRPMQSDNLYLMVLAGQQACPQRLSSLSLGHLRRPKHRVSLWIILLSLRPSYLVGSKWSLLHNVVFSDPYGFRFLPVTRKQTLCNRSSLSISFGPVDYSFMAALSRSQP
jgi:hypothetical protein